MSRRTRILPQLNHIVINFNNTNIKIMPEASQSQLRLKSKTITQRSSTKSHPSQPQFSRLKSQYSSRNAAAPASSYAAWSFLEARRENQLNSLFNIRKHKLDEITRANYLIYSKINTQESYYNYNGLEQQENLAHSKNSFTKFHTMNESGQQGRRVLGPIGNFRPLELPTYDTQDVRSLVQARLQNKCSSLAKIPAKKLKTLNSQELRLPIIFQFY